MAGAKTRVGFSSNGSEPPDSDEARAARTVMGHDIHLQTPPDVLPASQLPLPAAFPTARGAATPIPRAPTPLARAAVPVYQPEESTEELPSRQRSRSGRSRLARFLGRWTESGRFVSESHLPEARDDLEIPRDPLARNLVLVLAVALVTFSLTFLVVKLRQHVAGTHTPAPPAQTTSLPPAHPQGAIEPVPR